MDVALFHLMSLNNTSETPSGVVSMVSDMVQAAEDLGFDASWFAEHHFSSASVCASPLMMAAHCAGRTKSIQLGTAVVALPLYHPLRVVQEIGMLEAMSGGRTLLGLATGHQPHEYSSYGIPLGDRSGLMNEGWDIIEQGLVTGIVDYQGQHYRIPETFITNATGRMPPVFLAGSDDQLMRRAIRSGGTLLVSAALRTPEQLVPTRDTLMRLVEEVRPGGTTRPLCLQRHLFITDDPGEARLAAEMLLRFNRVTAALRHANPRRNGVMIEPVPFPGEPSVDWILENLPIGPAEKVLAFLRRDIEVMRPSHLSVYMGFTGLPPAKTMNSLRLFGEKILPEMQRFEIAVPA